MYKRWLATFDDGTVVWITMADGTAIESVAYKSSNTGTWKLISESAKERVLALESRGKLSIRESVPPEALEALGIEDASATKPA